MVETKSERFRRLAESRGNRLIREIQILGNLSNRKNYEYTPEEVSALFGPIEDELARARDLFDKDRPAGGKVRLS